MSFFGMGSMEIVVIMIIALIIFGPGRIPEIAGQAGKAVRDFRRITRELTSEFQESIDDVQSTMTEVRTTVDDMKRDTAAIAASIPESVEEGVGKPLSDAAGSVRPARNGATGSQTDVPIAEAPAPVATKSDPLADLIEIQEELDDSVRPSAGR
ncbi:MAG TPA: twin-arginine translocase TatA/TatE family subunit [Thermomicrobiales bacterium]|nr:twin-arginine translocase TatA/TatE family subunit [Thermomicrobiales bacterium]